MTRIDGADLQTACITLSQQKLKWGSHDRDGVPLIPQQRKWLKKWVKKKGWHRSSQNKRLFGEA